MSTIPALLLERLDRSPDAPILWVRAADDPTGAGRPDPDHPGWSVHTLAESIGQVGGLDRRLASLGVGPGVRVAAEWRDQIVPTGPEPEPSRVGSHSAAPGSHPLESADAGPGVTFAEAVGCVADENVHGDAGFPQTYRGRVASPFARGPVQDLVDEALRREQADGQAASGRGGP